ncbi:hypothetical protein GCM10010201_05900 [Pilimelia columellifera subsp. columellifera]|uniref:Uncharacterized protein n=2 Tax=Pilimelia TaxID=53370 RepID=A0ABN3N326_9ACTN
MTLTATATPALAGAVPIPVKQPLVGPGAVIYCDSLEPFPGDDPSQLGPGDIALNQSPNGSTVSADVVLRAAAPNTVYFVRLIQSDGIDCHTFDATTTTNAHGTGFVRVEEPTRLGATATQVIIDTAGQYGFPTFRAAARYELAVDVGPIAPLRSVGSANSARP